ncbi:ABC transporter substrate-binding protein [Leucobacter weissii]|uniref:ABC transporter substrate-binding protein n=1 Tax=Leucobacter weissii TaxID=1983706 RepID=UPI0031330686
MRTSKMKATIALLAVGGLALAGCASGSRDTDGGGAETELLTTTEPAVGDAGKIVWNSAYGELASLDPIKAFNYPENQVVANLCETLYQVQPDLSVQPHLATSAESADGKTWVLGIRDDVTFWDGSPMTVDDVIFSLNRHLDPDEGSYWASATTANIESIEQTADWEVTVELAEPDAVFTDSLSNMVGVVVQEDYREEAGENYGNPDAGVMCTGPYQVGDWKQGQSITLDRYDGYWNQDRAAKTAQIEIGFVVDSTAISNGLSTGEIQGSYDVPLAALGQLSSSDSGALHYGEGLQIMAIIPTGNGAFADPAVRRAITRATDREAIAETVYEGTASASRSVVPEAAWSQNPEVAQLRDDSLPDLGYDVEAAKHELDAAEADLSAPIKIAYPSERGFYADILNEMARGAQELGVTLEPVGVPSAQFGAFFSDAAAREGYDGFVTTNYLGSSEPLPHLRSLSETDGDQNYSGFSDPAIDAKLAEARAEVDPTRRAELTVEAEALIMEQQPWVPVTDLWVRLYMDASITGAPASFVYLYYPWAADLGTAE